MNAHSLKSRQLLAALRTLPECWPHDVDGVAAYVEAADKVEELERALGVLRQNMDAAVGTIAQAVRMAWKGAEITQSVRTVLNLPVPQWAQAHGWDYAVPEWLSSEERLVDASWSNDAMPSFQTRHLADEEVYLTFWCDHPDVTKREPRAGLRFVCTIGDHLVWQTESEQEARTWMMRTLLRPCDVDGWREWSDEKADIPHLRSLITGQATV